MQEHGTYAYCIILSSHHTLRAGSKHCAFIVREFQRSLATAETKRSHCVEYRLLHKRCRNLRQGSITFFGRCVMGLYAQLVLPCLHAHSNAELKERRGGGCVYIQVAPVWLCLTLCDGGTQFTQFEFCSTAVARLHTTPTNPYINRKVYVLSLIFWNFRPVLPLLKILY